MIILSLTFLLADKLEVDGDLKVTGNIEAGQIESLQQTIVELQAQIISLQSQITILQNQLGLTPDCAGVIGGSAIIDLCGVCNGDNSTCATIMTDVDGNAYTTTIIGNQEWFTSNLKVQHYNNNDEIEFYTSTSYDEGVGYYTDYDGDSNLYNDYGNLYSWDVANDNRNICPDGSHVPSKEEFQTLIDYIGGTYSGYKLRETGDEHWQYNDNSSSIDEFGFTALPGGYRAHSSGALSWIGQAGWFWTSSQENENTSNSSWYFRIASENDGEDIEIWHDDQRYGYSIRCIID